MNGRIVFGNNDLPGVMLASAVSTYLHRYGVLPGRDAVVFTNNDDGYQCALDLKVGGRTGDGGRSARAGQRRAAGAGTRVTASTS